MRTSLWTALIVLAFIAGWIAKTYSGDMLIRGLG